MFFREESRSNDTKIICNSVLFENMLELFLFWKLGNLNYTCAEVFTANPLFSPLNRLRFITTCQGNKTKGSTKFSKHTFLKEKKCQQINKILWTFLIELNL